MDVQLESLIKKIKQDGIGEADKQSRQIISKAENEASRVIKEAKSEASRIVEKAREDVARMEEAGKRALEQAGRDLILSLENDITSLFNRILEEAIGEALSADKLADILEKLITNWDRGRAGGGKGVEVLLSEEDWKSLKDGLLGKLREEITKGVTLRPAINVESGFRIGEKGGAMHYDFTAEGIAQMLTQYLSPFLVEILRSSKK